MCHDCIIVRNGQTTVSTTQYELAKNLNMPVRKLPICEGYPETAIRGNACLCPIDLQKLGKSLGLHITPPYTNQDQNNDEWILSDTPEPQKTTTLKTESKNTNTRPPQ